MKLPEYDFIKLEAVPPASTLLFYGGNKWTEFYGRKRYKHPYDPPAFHATFYIENGLMLNVGKFKTLTAVEREYASTRRVDAIIYRTIPDNVRKELMKDAYLGADDPKFGLNLPTYGWTDFLRFEPLLQWLPKNKHDICSEDVYKRFARYGIETATKPQKVEVAPWMLYEFALAHPELCDIKTVWRGLDFKG